MIKKFCLFLKKNKLIFLLLFFSFISSFIFLYKLTSLPPCLNADEVTNAYDAYSILKTGKDQYGNFLPLRFASFGDYKLPLLTYLAIPFIKIFDLNELAIRLVNLPFVFFYPIIIYFLIKEFFQKNIIALIGSFLISINLGLFLIARQAHEGYLTTFFLTFTCLFFIKFIKTKKSLHFYIFSFFILISLFGYHFSRLWLGFYFLIIIFLIIKKQINFKYLLIIILTSSLFLITDYLYKPTRINNLLFFKNIGFILKIEELKNEDQFPFIYNKFTIGANQILNSYLQYLSPNFLVINGDANHRFGYPEMGPITITEYIFIFFGLYFLFKNKEKWRYFILGLLLFSPISGSLTWADNSITRTLFIFVPINIIVSYGFYQIIKNKYLFILTVLSFFYFSFYNWNFYFFHYPKRTTVIRSWQCGYKEMVDYVKNNYQKFDKFYITKKNGQPYIYLLFYLKYPPEKYQKVAKLSSPDEYGFNQVNEFDKFYFELYPIDDNKNVSLIGYPDDFLNEDKRNFKEIKVNTETIFLIKEILNKK